jgi:hypothetical protein
MQPQNAVRNDNNSAVRTGLFLAHSRNWTPEQCAREAARLIQRQDQIARRELRTLAKADQGISKLRLSLIAATLCAPLVWAGHALLQWKHVL